MDGQDFILSMDRNFCAHPHHMHISLGASAASYPVNTRGTLLGAETACT